MPTEPEPMPNESFDWQAATERLAGELERDHPPAWMPEQPGEQLVGVLVAVNPAAPTARGPVPVATLQGPNGGQRSVWLHHTVLRRAFERLDVQLGELVAIRYQGRVKPETGGNEYADYRVAVDRPSPTGAVSWRTIAERYGDDEAAQAQNVDELAADYGHVDDPVAEPLLPTSPGRQLGPDDDIPF